MTDLYLIAHKVRGEPAFDVATQMECPECPEGTDEGFCAECDNTGWWWIIPTSGHRAYPYWNTSLHDLRESDDNGYYALSIPVMPPNLPDHYPPRAEPQRSLVDLLGLTTKPKPPVAPIVRRF